MIFSSEPLEGENVWSQMRPGHIVAVDRGMNFFEKNEPRLRAIAGS
jgi:predicted glutamine amidotransferase